jgi:hypothetical protein
LGQREFTFKAPAVMSWDGDRPKTFAMGDVLIKQTRGRKIDQEGYYVEEFDLRDALFVPRDRFGRWAQSAFLFTCYTSEPTQERPGVYMVACDSTGHAFWCGCLGSRGWHQESDCKHKSLINTLAGLEPRPERE